MTVICIRFILFVSLMATLACSPGRSNFRGGDDYHSPYFHRLYPDHQAAQSIHRQITPSEFDFLWTFMANMKADLTPCYKLASEVAMKNYFEMNPPKQENSRYQKSIKTNKKKNKEYGSRKNTTGSDDEQMVLSRLYDIANKDLAKINQFKKEYPSLKRELYAASLDLGLLINLLKYQKFMKLNKDNLASSRERKIGVLKEGDVFLKMAMYDLYRLQEEYKDTHYYQFYVEREDTQNVAYIVFELERQISLVINTYYDDKYGYKAKYYKQVDPNDFVVIAFTDKITKGIYDKEAIKKAIFSFVKSKVQYRYDPAWKTDGVQPPALTLLSGRGDCEDHAILMASMFMRAGIYDVKLCEAAVKGKSNFDHMYINAGEKSWDNLVPNVTKYRHKCVDLYQLSAHEYNF